ncbi:Crp/Fnr family transcriptional regulator [Flavobacterium sp. 140616W15]|uniref:Crp/Fnr family transcriptional regulator n=1 Tax=Flavobacterium sp. 140616W15 TaxID=2478552 RepID=UPI001013C7BA|nr:Crp/Fnr family transcriptional regulator [Flavobacterium sp. 140616W15]
MIFNNLNFSDQISSDFLEDFSKLMTFQELPSKHLLHHEGTICSQLFILHKGLARAYYYKDAKDITAHFAIENTTITAIDSFIQRKKSRYNIELLEDTSLSYINYNDWKKLLEDKPHYEKYARIFLENIYIDIAERIEDLLFHSAKERYAKLNNKFPSLQQRVNLGYIASYIGITQETLSRIRAEK